MKAFLFAAFLFCATGFWVCADVVVPKPTILTVSNLAAFADYKFMIATGSGDNAKTQPLQDRKAYELYETARLLVADAASKPRVWATVEYPRFSNGRQVKITIKEVRHGDQKIEVAYDIQDTVSTPPPKKRPPHTASAWPPFVLAGLGCCGLVLLAPHSRRSSAGTP